jgi:hypothetical protein
MKDREDALINNIPPQREWLGGKCFNFPIWLLFTWDVGLEKRPRPFYLTIPILKRVDIPRRVVIFPVQPLSKNIALTR